MHTMRMIQATAVIAALGAVALPARAGTVTIDFEDGSRGAPQPFPAHGLLVFKGVRFSAVPIPEVCGIVYAVRVLERSRLRSLVCPDPSSQNRVLGNAIESLPIRADFPPGLIVNEVSVEIVTCSFNASLTLYDSQEAVLASAATPASTFDCSHVLRAVSPQPVAYAIVDVPSVNCVQCTPAQGCGRCTSFWIDSFTFETATGP